MNDNYRNIAYYTDGTPVQEGDRVRYHQQPGGLMSPETDRDGNIKWHEGVAAKYPPHVERREQMLATIERDGYGLDPDELLLKRFERSSWGGEYAWMAGHVIERLP